MTRNERRLKGIEQTAAGVAQQIQDLWDLEKKEERNLDEGEREQVVELTRQLKGLKEDKQKCEADIALEREVRETTRGIVDDEPKSADARVTNEPAPQKSLGQMFVESKGYQSLLERGVSGSFSTGPITLETKATLTTTPGTALTPPTWQPGVVETLFQRLTVADLIPSSQTSAPVIKYVRESTATNAAAATAEAALKPESALAFTEVTTNVQKIATFLPVSDEMLEDAEGIQGYLNSRLALFVQQTEEAQILRGNGSSPQIQGIIGASGVNTISVSGTAGTAITENLFTVMNNTRGSSFLSPDAVIVHPNQFAAIRLSKDGQSQYYGGGPFFGPYGNDGAATSSQFDVFDYWGVRFLVTTAVGAGTALVGNFSQGAGLFRRAGLEIEASNSHSDFFQRNLTAIRAEERLALAIYRPSAFTTVTFT